MTVFEPLFPGMDPFIEDQRWAEFHNALITHIHHELARLLVPLYSVRAEAYIHLHVRPDDSIYKGRSETEPLERSTVRVMHPTRLILPTLYDEDLQQRIEIRDADGKLVTVIELLSPANKGRHRDRYLANRDSILYSDVNLVEIDLLRGGERTEMSAPTEGYFIMVARTHPNRPHTGEAYDIGLRDPLPIIPVPLIAEEEDVPRLFREIYIASRYRLQLNYDWIPTVSFMLGDWQWVQDILKKLQE